MRLTLALVIAVAIAVAVYVAADGDTPAADAGAVTLVGDSLNVGIEPALRDELPRWSIDAHDRVGRSTAEGIDELRSLKATLAPVVVVSLGTNDAEGSEAEFRRLVDEALAIAGPERCVVWSTIVRDGEPRTGFNDVLNQAASVHANLRLVDWVSLTGQDGVLARDGVHGTADGYARRAAESARAVRGCSA